MPQPPAPASAVARALALILLAAVFLRAGGAPVAQLDSWSDWKYGQWIWEHGRLPKSDPFSPYSDRKLEVRQAGWLADVTYYLAGARGGLEGVSLLHALLETAKAGLFLLAVRRATGSLGTAVVAAALMEAACWPFTDAVRSGTPAEVCWAALLLACSGRVPSRAAVVAAPLVVAVWANLGLSFAFGLLLLVGLLVGRYFEEMRARRGVTRAALDPGVQRLALMLALSVVAACFNPYDFALVKEAVGLDAQALPALPARLWPRLIPVHLWESRAVIASVLVVLVVLRLSPRPFTPAEALLATSFALWAWYDKRVAPWWLMLAPWLLAPHLKAMFDAVRAMRPAAGKPAPRWPLALGAAAAALLVLLSPAARWARGRPLPPEERVGGMAPQHLAATLAERTAPPLRIFCLPYWWGDYLLWRLPPEDRVFWYSHPEGYVKQRGTDPGLDPTPDEWRALVQRYRFNVLAVRKDSSAGLSAYLATTAPGEWEIIADNSADDAPGGDGSSRGLVVLRRTDPFVLSLAQADAAQACVGGFGLAPTAGNWSVLTQLPWVWPPPAPERP